MRKIKLGSVDLSKSSPLEGKGTRNSVAVVSDVSPSRFTVNNSINIVKATQAQMETLSTSKKAKFFTNIARETSRNNLMYA